MNDFHSELLSVLNSITEEPENTQLPVANSSTYQPQTPGLQLPSTMSTNYQLLKMYVDVIPNFDGNTFLLNDFITSCTELITAFQSATNDNQNAFLIRAIRSKLHGRAQQLISSRLEVATWTDIKQMLVQNFGDSRDLPCLQQDLLHLQFDKSKQTLLQFGNQVSEFQSMLMTKLQQTNKTVDVKLALAEVYQQLALDTYVRNLPSHLQQMVRTKEFNTIEDAMAFVTKEEQFAQYKQSICAPNQKPKLLNQPNPNMNRFRPQQQFFQNPRNYAQPTFPSIPINVQPRPTQQRFPTNTQVFGRQNVWKPQKNLNAPGPSTPMSDVSVQPKRPNSNLPRQNFNSRYQPPQTPMSGVSIQPRRQTFHSTELFNTEIPDESQLDPTPDTPDYSYEFYDPFDDISQDPDSELPTEDENFTQTGPLNIQR